MGTRLHTQKPVSAEVGQPQERVRAAPWTHTTVILVCVGGAVISCLGQI